MPKSPVATESPRALVRSKGIAAAELALKAHVLASDPDMLAEIPDGDWTMQEIAETVDLTEAPEDAVCGLVADLLSYCEREKIDWREDVISRAWEHFRNERAYEISKAMSFPKQSVSCDL